MAKKSICCRIVRHICVRRNWKPIIWLIVLGTLGLTLYLYASAPSGVKFAVVRTVKTAETLGATGKVRGERVADLGLDAGGVIKRVYIHEGDFVHSGTLLISLDKTDFDSKIQSSQAALASAEADYRRACVGAQPADIKKARAELAQADYVGRARVAQMQARLRDLQSGSRSQEISAAQSELRRVKAILNKSQKDYNRTALLVKQGALAASQLDQAETDLETAKADVDAQQDKLSLLKEGAKSYQIDEAKAALDEAKVSRKTNVDAAREALNSLLALPRHEDVLAAKSKVDEARTNLRNSLDDKNKTDLVAPFDGVVSSVPVEDGQSISPGQKLVELQEIKHPVIEVETDEENLSTLSIGQKAVISTDAYPGKTFEAEVYDLGSNVNSERGTVKIKLRPLSKVSWIRPDLTVDVNIVLQRQAHRIILPLDVVTKYNGSSVVLVIRDNVAKPVKVATGAVGESGVVIFGDLKDGERVVRHASTVNAYDSVSVIEGN